MVSISGHDATGQGSCLERCALAPILRWGSSTSPSNHKGRRHLPTTSHLGTRRMSSRDYSLSVAQADEHSGSRALRQAEPAWLNGLVGTPRSRRRYTFMVTTMFVICTLVGATGVGVGLLTGSVGWGLAAALLACPLLWVATVIAIAASAGWAATHEALSIVFGVVRQSHHPFFPRLPPRR